MFLKGKIPTIKEDLGQNTITIKIPDLVKIEWAVSNRNEKKPVPLNLKNSSNGTPDSVPSSNRSTLKSSPGWTHHTGAG